LGAVFVVEGTLGATVKASLAASFYNILPRIDLDWTFTFADASLGRFFDDDTKLRVQWSLSFKGMIHHDIAFGVVESRDERPFFPTSWVDISDDQRGFAYLHQGTIKHWVTGRTLFNLFAWGENTDAIGNRLSLARWPKSFDQRLSGQHSIRTAILPHAGNWRDANLVGAARSYGMPPFVAVSEPHPGNLPAELSVIQIIDPGIAATATRVEDGQILCRVYSVKDDPAALEVKLNGLKAAGWKAITGEQLEKIGPYQIAQLRLT